MLVTVVMPMRNAEAFVQEALSSVLAENDLPLEVVVVDDGSSDQSRLRVESLNDKRVRIVNGPGRGFSASINTGLAVAQGDVIMQCDADDLYPPGRIKRQAAWLTDHPDYDAVCGAFSTIDVKGHPVANLAAGSGEQAEDIEAELRRGTTRTSLCTFAFRRHVFDKVGLHREYFETSSDIDFQLRLGEVGRVHYLPENTYFYRLHGFSITHTQGNARREFFENMAREFQRQRQTAGVDVLANGTPPVPPMCKADSPGDVKLQIQGMLLGEAWRSLSSGNKRGAAGGAWRAILANPRSLGTWRSSAALFLRLLTSSPKQRRVNHD